MIDSHSSECVWGPYRIAAVPPDIGSVTRWNGFCISQFAGREELGVLTIDLCRRKGGFMLTVTESAGAYLGQLLVDHDASEEVAVRFLLVGEQLRPMLDNIRPGDVMFEHEGKTILVLDEPLSERLTDNTLDLKEAGDGIHLSLR
jgi:hypothetical protein